MRNGGRLLTATLALVLAAAAPACKHAHGRARRITLSVVGTSDLHGHLDGLPMFGGFVNNLRRLRARDGGAVLLVDAGDLFQGTLESNLGEGEPVVRAYAALGYAAAAIGNHDFDYGPVGPATVPSAPGDDRRGALRARAAEAPFPFLDANLVETATGQRPAWDNVVPGVVRDIDGVKVGILGVTTIDTARATLPATFVGLAATPLVPAIVAEAAELRRQGAQVVIALAHAGGDCHHFKDPDDLTGCGKHDEIFAVARKLPAGTVDLIVAGHTHKGIAHRVNGIPIVEAYANGRAFSRVDLNVDRETGRVTGSDIYPPHEMPPADSVELIAYEGEVVSPDRTTAAAIAPALAAARPQRARPLGVELPGPLLRSTKSESPLGDLVVDLMRAAHPEADVAVLNASNVRIDLPAGPLTYGRLYEALPFDNAFATLSVTGAELSALIAANLVRDDGILLVSGLQAVASCADGRLNVSLARTGGGPIAPEAHLTMLTSNFLATGGGQLFPDQLQRRAQADAGPVIRDAVASQLTRRGLPPLADDDHPRLAYAGKRPLRCD